MNTIIIMGRFTRDPEIRYSQDNKPIARVSIAVDRRYKQEGQPEADFFNLVGFGKTAEFIEKYFHKGMKALVTGELRNNNYTDKDGIKHYNILRCGNYSAASSAASAVSAFASTASVFSTLITIVRTASSGMLMIRSNSAGNSGSASNV